MSYISAETSSIVTTEEFLENITGWNQWADGFLEIAIDFREARYFDQAHLSEAVAFAREMASSGHDIHFGPAVREKDLGSARSGQDNVFWTKCLWVDIDSPDKSLAADEKRAASKLHLDQFLERLGVYGFAPSYIISSGHGYHVYFVIRRIHQGLDKWKVMEGAIIAMAQGDSQAKDPGRLLRLPGTFNFKDKDNPKAVEIVGGTGSILDEDVFDPIVKEYGVRPAKTVIPQRELKPLGSVPPCLSYLLDPGTKVEKGCRHLCRLVLGTFAFHEGWPVEDTIQRVRHFTEDPKKSEADIRGIYEALAKDPSRYSVGCGEGSNLRTLIDAGITLCDKEQCPLMNASSEAPVSSEKQVYSASFNGLVDLVADDQGHAAFLVKENGMLVVKKSYKVDDKVLLPPPAEQIRWLLPKASVVMEHVGNDNDNRLFIDLVNYFKGVSELPDENHYKFIAAYCFHTYLINRFQYTPILGFFSIPERGKTRTGRAIVNVSYRGITIVTLREPLILRLAKDHRATIFFDISDLWKKAEAAGVEDILYNRYEKGGEVGRVLYPERGAFQDTVYYDVSGATLFATNKPVNDVLESRTVQVIMPQATRSFEQDILLQDGLPFKERLVAFRARWMDRQLPEMSKPCLGRLGDVLKPINQIVRICCPDDSWFGPFVAGVERNRRQSRSESEDARIIQAILAARSSLKHGHLFNEDVLSNLNKDVPLSERISPQALGKTTSGMGFKKYASGQKRGFYWNAELLKSLCQRYGLEYIEIQTFEEKEKAERKPDPPSFEGIF